MTDSVDWEVAEDVPDLVETRYQVTNAKIEAVAAKFMAANSPLPYEKFATSHGLALLRPIKD